MIQFELLRPIFAVGAIGLNGISLMYIVYKDVNNELLKLKSGIILVAN